MLRKFSSPTSTFNHSISTNNNCVGCLLLVASSATSVRHNSSAYMRGHEVPWRNVWSYDPPSAASLPKGSMDHPHPDWNNKLRKTVYEWRNFYGHGQKVRHMGPTRELPDWEHADGTPAPHSGNRFSYMVHKHDLLAQIIRAGADVERRAAADQLPRIPASQAQRDWDPEIPLYLEDDDERGGEPAPEWFVPSQKFSTIPRNGFAVSAKKFPDTPSETGKKDADAEELEVLAPISEYEPSSFISEPVPFQEQVRPFWNRRLWSLTDDFLILKPLRNKNTIGSN